MTQSITPPVTPTVNHYERPPQPRGCWAQDDAERDAHAPSWLYDAVFGRWCCLRCEPPRGACPNCRTPARLAWRERPPLALRGQDGVWRSSPQGYVCRICHPAHDDAESLTRRRVGVDRGEAQW